MQRRRKSTLTKYSLSEKIAMVREATQPNTTVNDAAKRLGVSPRTISLWRTIYGDVNLDELLGDKDPRIADLKLQVQRLEVLLGQRTYEIFVLKERLAELNGRQKSQ